MYASEFLANIAVFGQLEAVANAKKLCAGKMRGTKR
jgi:hypothetical protein